MKLSKNITLEEFDNNYWYAIDLKCFAKEIGVKGAKNTRKDQLEVIIRRFIITGEVSKVEATLKKEVTYKDYDGSELKMNTQVENYCSNKITKSFILAAAKKIQPDLPKKSGVWYWINRWREEQLKNNKLTYGDIVHQFIELSNKAEKLPRIPSTKFNNFITDFLAANMGNRHDALIAWEQLKSINIPKTFEAWKKQNF